jgi:predicted transcriptional regulator
LSRRKLPELTLFHNKIKMAEIKIEIDPLKIGVDDLKKILNEELNKQLKEIENKRIEIIEKMKEFGTATVASEVKKISEPVNQTKETIKSRILQCIKESPSGLTNHEICAKLGLRMNQVDVITSRLSKGENPNLIKRLSESRTMIYSINEAYKPKE